MTIAIMSAMHEENALIVDEMEIESEQKIGSRTYYSGQLEGQALVVVFSHWGKVAASITATTLVNRFNVTEIIFTGVAGAINAGLSVGDIVIGTDLYQHDMDASPIIPRHEIPLLGRAEISTDKKIRVNLEKAVHDFIHMDFPNMVAEEAISSFDLHSPEIQFSAIASGDQFISDPTLSAAISKRLPQVRCVEMEGAAVAQVAESFNVPFGIIRTISDGANETSAIDFQAFIQSVASVYSLGIVRRYLKAKSV